MSYYVKTIINEDAYLSEEEESKLLLSINDIVARRKLNIAEEEDFLITLPALRMFAETNLALFGEEEYLKIENRNIEIIKNREWEKD